MPDPAHSIIGASSAARWLNCPGSVALCATVPKKTSDYASEGTAAHELCERCLLDGTNATDHLGEVITADGKDWPVTDLMSEGVQLYLDIVRTQLKLSGGELYVEQKFSLEWLFPNMFGRNDSCIITGVFGDLCVFDFKYGRKPVEAENNPQCAYYALGALGEKNDLFVDKVYITIVQPNSMDGVSVRGWNTTAKELYAWGKNVLKPAAEATTKPGAKLASGEWCCFCDAKAVCPFRLSDALSRLDKSPVPQKLAFLPELDRLTPEQIGRASEFFQSDEFQGWVKALAAEEITRLEAGDVIPGRKLVSTIVWGNRKWYDEAQVPSSFAKILGEEVFNQKVKSPAQIEAALKKAGLKKQEAADEVAPLVTRDESQKLIVVSDSDPRESLSDSQAKAVALFNELPN